MGFWGLYPHFNYSSRINILDFLHKILIVTRVRGFLRCFCGSQHHLKLIVLYLFRYTSVKGKEELVSLYCLDQYVVKLNCADERLLKGSYTWRLLRIKKNGDHGK